MCLNVLNFKSIKVSQYYQPLYILLELDKKTAISVGRHLLTNRYHFFMMIRNHRWLPWKELCEIYREQIVEEYPELVRRVEEFEELSRMERFKVEQHYQRMSKLQIFSYGNGYV